VAAPADYRISGKVTSDGTAPVVGASVTNGVATVVTDAQGNYALPAGVGSHTVSVAKAPYEFSAFGVTIEYASVTRNFQARTGSISGQITGVPAGTVVTVTDGVRSRSVTISSGQVGGPGGGPPTGYYSLTMPYGQYHITASANGYSFSPLGWSNPVTINGTSGQTPRNYVADAVRQYSARGRVTGAAGEALAGVTVSAGAAASAVTDTYGAYALTGLAAGDHTITATLDGHTFSPASRVVSFAAGAADAAGQDFTESTAALVLGRRVFYNNSFFDGNNAAAGAADDAAIATDKVALLPGGTATFANYTSYSRGLNGIMIDLVNLPAGVVQLSRSNDFIFRVGNDNAPANWPAAPSPEPITSIRRGAGAGGSDRVTIVWPEGSIRGKWLQVTLKATANTGLAAADVFYFGNAPGESGNWATAALVNSVDEAGARHHPRGAGNPAPVTYRWDYNRDGRVNFSDVYAARGGRTSADTALKLINLAAPRGVTITARAPKAFDLFAAARPIGPAREDNADDVLT
jgi:hypothetical protein